MGDVLRDGGVIIPAERIKQVDRPRARWTHVPLKYALKNVVEKAEGRPMPFVALEHIASGTGALVNGFKWTKASPEQYVRFRPGDILFGKLRPYLRKVLLTDRNGCCPTELLVLRPQPSLDSGFGYYLVQSDNVISYAHASSYGVKMPRTSWDQLGRLGIQLPPLPEQRAIAAFLDRETARIDELVAMKRALIDRLDGSLRGRQAKALLGGGPIPDTGPGPHQVDLSEGWRLLPFKRLFTEIDERSNTGDEMLLSVSQTKGVIPQSDLGDRHQYAESLVGYKRCEAGDLVVNRMWVYYGALGIAPCSGIVSPDYSVFRRSCPDVDAEFMASVLRTHAYVAEMTRLVRGIGTAFQGQVRKPRLHPRELGAILMPVPPLDQSERIVAELGALRQGTEHLIRAGRNFIDLLKERRQALITAAVTGRIDVA